MALAKDEAWGLLVACAIGASALGLWAYRQVTKPPPAHVEAMDSALTEQAERDAFAEALEIAFVEDGADASVDAADTTLAITWFPCSKPMLDRLLRKRNDALTKRVREASGLSIDRLKTLGFTQVVCDNQRGTKATDDLAPRRSRR